MAPSVVSTHEPALSWNRSGSAPAVAGSSAIERSSNFGAFQRNLRPMCEGCER
jgi:hypothetical protein